MKTLARQFPVKRLSRVSSNSVRISRSKGNPVYSPLDISKGIFNPKTHVAVDVESTGVDVWGQRIVGGAMCDDLPFSVSMCDEEGNQWYCEWQVDPFTRKVQASKYDIDFINETITDKGVIFHNSKFDCRMLSKVGVDIIRLAKTVEDTLFMARVTYTLEFDYGLKFLAKKYLGIEDIDEKSLQDAVKQARNKARRYNTRAVKENKPLILINDSGGKREGNADYWLPGWYAENYPDECGHWKGLNGKYNNQDTFRTMLLFRMYTQVMDDEGIDPDGDGNYYLRETYLREMREVWPIVNDMEERGLRTYPEAVVEESQKCMKAMIAHKANMQKMVDELGLKPFTEEQLGVQYTPTGRVSTAKRNLEFNPGSSQQILRILYLPKGEGGLGIPIQYARKGDRRGTPENIANGVASLTADKDTLRELMYVPFVQELVQWRGASHIKSLFFDSLLGVEKDQAAEFLIGKGRIKKDRRYKRGWKVHPGMNQCGTKTGRFSAGGDMGINPQQATAGGKKSLGGGKFSSQKVFGPRPGYVWLGFDFSQQEGRIFAELAGVKVMLDALYANEDLFEAMANRTWGGKGNPNAYKAGVQALDLFKGSPSNCPKCEGRGYDKDTELPCKSCKTTGSMVGLYWKEIGWTQKRARGLNANDPEIARIVETWLSAHEYNIVKAESSIGKEASRQRCKHITYAKIFGGGPGSYTHLLYCTLEEAKEFDREYNETMPEMKAYMKSLENFAKQTGYIVNLYGRKLRVDSKFAYRAVSYMIQGSAADMMKDSLIKVYKFLKRVKGLDAHIVLTIHDEIKIEIKESQLTDGIILAIASRMEDNAGRIKVPMPVGLSVCKDRWSVGEEEFALSDTGLLEPKKK